jgi:radical SAM protein with 4Fe4S-binding SPASM domain
MDDNRKDKFPVLADHVRLQPLTDYVKVVNIRSGEILHLSRREAVCLEMARGGSPLREIAQVVGGVYQLDDAIAHELAEAALGLFGQEVEWRDEQTLPRTISDPLRLFKLDAQLRPPAPFRQERPTRLTLSITAACNYRCSHCCNRSGTRMPGELTAEQWRDVIRGAGEIGVISITFSGGEPLVRPELPELISEASAAGVYPILSTNASLINRAVARDLGKADLRFAHVSLCAATPPLYDRLTGRHGWFGRALDGIRNLKSEGVYIRLKTVLLPGNLDEISCVLDIADAEGVNEVHLAPYRLTHLAPGGSSLLLAPEELEVVVTAVEQWRERTGSAMVVRTPVPEQERLAWCSAQDIVRCGGIKQELTILPDGRITVCEILKDRPEFVVGHVLRDGLMKVWQSARPEQVMEEAVQRATGPCRTCEHLPICRTGCFSLSIACGGTSSSPDPRCWKAKYADNPFREPGSTAKTAHAGN